MNDKQRLELIKRLVNQDDSWLMDLCERLIRENEELRKQADNARTND